MTGAGSSWGRYPRATQRILPFRDRRAELPAADGTLLPYGNGRSYGDSCLNDGGNLLRARDLDRFMAFDPHTGVLQCEAGVLLSEILELVVPRGWFLPVTPGTRFVTVGGAIANDVHGKNHHRAGTFGCHLLAFELLRSDGSRMICSASHNQEWFAATLGGLGLTGLITSASIQLRRISGPWLSAEVHRFGNIGDFLRLSEGSNRGHEYTVAWIDCVAKRSSLGRGLFTRANHAEAQPELQATQPSGWLRVPFAPPFPLVNAFTLRAFNSLYFHSQRASVRCVTTHYERYFYPLDRISQWNLIYGSRGLLQYQCVVPIGDAERVISQLIGFVSDAGAGSFLAVLKQFGDVPSPGMLSFPRPGITLALDFPANEPNLRLLDRLDDVVAEAGGAVYPAKDARMAGKLFRQYFPVWEAFSQYIDPRFSSSFWRRVME